MRATALCAMLLCSGCATRLLTVTPPDLGPGAVAGADLSSGLADLAAAAADMAVPGMFTRVHTDVSCRVSAIASADFDGNGRNDLAVACADGIKGTVLLLMGSGLGTYKKLDLGPASPFYDYEHIATGDINGDGRPDVTASSISGGSVMTIFAIGGITTLTPVTMNGAPSGMALADLNSDGKLDLVAPQMRGGSPFASWSLGDGKGKFGAIATLLLQEQGLVGRGVARDLDGDGKVDLAIGTASPHVSILKGDGMGKLAPLTQVSVPTAGAANLLAGGDVDGDGLADLVVSDGSSLFMVTNHGGFSARLVGKSAGISDGAIGDLDGDGRPDIAVSDGSGATMFLQGANGSFSTPITVANIAGASAIAIADENGDQRNDIIVGSNGAIEIFLRL